MKSMFSAGKEEGREEGREEGKAEGIKEQNITIAKKMLEQNIDIETIIEVTGLAREEIEKLKD